MASFRRRWFAAVATARRHRCGLRNVSTAPHRWWRGLCGAPRIGGRSRQAGADRCPVPDARCRPCHEKRGDANGKVGIIQGPSTLASPHVRGVASRLRHEAAMIACHVGPASLRPDESRFSLRRGSARADGRDDLRARNVSRSACRTHRRAAGSAVWMAVRAVPRDGEACGHGILLNRPRRKRISRSRA